jgi:hypothetical protein
MGPEVMILIIIFRAFSEYFICFSTRNKERLALIEKALMPVFL